MSMNLAELLPQSDGMTDAELKGHALILSPELVAILEGVQDTLGSRQHIAQPTPLSDGTFMLCADLLSEIGPGGLYHKGFAAIPPQHLAAVQVVPWAEAVALLPAAEDDAES
jgi:hypothetical protein